MSLSVRRRWRRLAPAALTLVLLAVPATAAGLGASASPVSATHGIQRASEVDRLHAGAPSTAAAHSRLAPGTSMWVDRSLGLYPAGAARLAGGDERVVVDAASVPAVAAAVLRLGGRVEATWRNYVQAVVPSGYVATLSRLDSVNRLQPAYGLTEDSVAGEEVAASLASAWQAKGITGTGVKVAVIDGGFQGLADRQASGDLPTNVTTMDFCDGQFATATAHGTAVAEIVHEMAPGATMYLICVGTEVQLGQAEAYAKSQGVQIVNFSAGFLASGRGDGSGVAGSVVSDARSSGILWVNAAGNEAQTHWSGTYSDPDGDEIHEWSSNGDEGNTFIWPNDSVICGVLKWDEWPAGVSDFSLILFLSSTGQTIAVTSQPQTGTQAPLEGGCIGQSTGSDLVVAWAIQGVRVTTSPRLDLTTDSPPLQYETQSGSITDPATSPSALAVGALCWQNNALEPYSSQGPTIDGRVKPDIAGHDSVSSATYGAFSACPSAFAGTSAASPEVAGAAALAKQFHPAFGPNELQAFLESNAVDLGQTGKDPLTGAGQLRLPDPRDTTPPLSKALPTSGRKGTVVKLPAQITDDVGELRLTGDTGLLTIRDQIKKNGRVIASVQSTVTVPQKPTRVSMAWRIPARATGALQHCVRATDQQGNASPLSCARLAVR